MRVCIVSTTSIDDDPRALAHAHSTRLVGHEVVGVCVRPSSLDWVDALGRPGLVERLQGKTPHDRLVDIARAKDADLYIPAQPAAIDICRDASTRSAFLVSPERDNDRRSLIWRAPHHPRLSSPASGQSPTMHIPDGLRSTAIQGGPVVVAFRRTNRNTGRYMASALQRLGHETIELDSLDWNLVPKSARAVLVFESPLPALTVSGTNPGVPVVFWVHHGEHHLDANLRLQRKYEAQAVALAHSWHLAYRFDGVVERVPFGVAPELVKSDFRAHADRTLAAAFVGSVSADARYQRRAELIEDLKSRLGDDSVVVASDKTPQEMMAMYRSARIVPDDGAGRHLPITMRAFEATGAGSALVSRSAPGMDLIFEPGTDYIEMALDPVNQIVNLANGSVEAIARSGHSRAWSDHTYEQRATELLTTADRARESDTLDLLEIGSQSGYAGAVERFSDAQRVLDLETGATEALPDREVWDFSVASDRAEPRTFHVSLIDGGSLGDRQRAVAAARLAVIVPDGRAREIEPLVAAAHGEYTTLSSGGTTILTFGNSGYRVSNEPDAIPNP